MNCRANRRWTVPFLSTRPPLCMCHPCIRALVHSDVFKRLVLSVGVCVLSRKHHAPHANDMANNAPLQRWPTSSDMDKLKPSQSMNMAHMSDGGYLSDSEEESTKTLGSSSTLGSLHKRTRSLNRDDFISDHIGIPEAACPSCFVILGRG